MERGFVKFFSAELTEIKLQNQGLSDGEASRLKNELALQELTQKVGERGDVHAYGDAGIVAEIQGGDEVAPVLSKPQDTPKGVNVQEGEAEVPWTENERKIIDCLRVREAYVQIAGKDLSCESGIAYHLLSPTVQKINIKAEEHRENFQIKVRRNWGYFWIPTTESAGSKLGGARGEETEVPGTDFRKIISGARESRNMSRAQLATACGYSTPAVFQLECEQDHFPRVEFIKKIAEELKLDAMALWNSVVDAMTEYQRNKFQDLQ